MPAHDLAIGGAERGTVGEILVHVAHVPGQPHDVGGRAAGLFEHRGDVLQREPRLRDEAVGEAAIAVLPDHAADEHHAAMRQDAVGEALRPRPAGRPQHLVGSAIVRHGRLQDASWCGAASRARRRSSKRCSLPVWVRGSAATYSMARGYLYGAIAAFTWSCNCLVMAASPLKPGRSTA